MIEGKIAFLNILNVAMLLIKEWNILKLLKLAYLIAIIKNLIWSSSREKKLKALEYN